MDELKIVYLSPGDLHPYDKNARKHGDADVEAIAKSIQEFGFNDPIGVWGDANLIVEGHGRLEAAKQLGLDTVPCIRLDHLTPEQRRAYALAHNKTAELSEWDFVSLEEELKDLEAQFAMEDFGFDLSEFQEAEPAEAVDDDYDVDADVEAIAKRGDIFQLGRHRLMCGDSTEADDVAALMGGEQADLLLTDPPYNVSYEGGTGMTIMNDDMEDKDFREFLKRAFSCADAVMKPGASFYIWHADSEGYNFRGACHDIGWQVRQCLIWDKDSLVLGRQDYQWKHEPCQPAGTMVWTPDGQKPIEQLKDGDKVISFDTYSGCVKGYKEGMTIQTAKRKYDGLLYGICAAGRKTWATDNHEFSVRFNPDTSETWSTYLMVNEKGWWRVGVTRTYDARGFGLKHRLDQEHAEAAWIIETFENQADAQMGEQLLACKYGIPYTYWTIGRGQSPQYNHRTEKQIEWLYEQLPKKEMYQRAENLLCDYNRSINYPIITSDTKSAKFSRRITAKINACNIIPGLMMVPIPKEQYEGTSTFEWSVIDAVQHKEHHGLVYSLAVDKYHHYISDGIVTHNCLYGWKEGSAHEWLNDRKQTTVLEFDRPKKSDLHPTMKPVPLFDYQIRNSCPMGGRVLDLFGGSGTTVIACEQDGRCAYTMELDPHYADVIVARWETLTGEKAKLVTP